MEEKIEPCSQEEHGRFFREFQNNKQCDYDCREEQLEKLAENFESKKDGLYLRALLCANKDYYSNRYMALKFDTSVPFINKAVAHKNVDFLKVFFGLYSHERSTAITFTNNEQWSYRSSRSHVAEPSFDWFNQLEAIKDEGVAELMFAHLKQPVSLAVIARCNVLPFFAPGCKFACKKYQQDTEAALQEAAKLEQKKQAWKQSLREVGK